MGVTKSAAQKTKTGASRLIKLYHPRNIREKGILWTIGLTLATYLVIVLVLGFLWNSEPDTFDVREAALEMAGGEESRLVTGYITTATTIQIAETLLNKPGGYLSNDIMPPGVFMDNIPNWEFGVLVQLRDMAGSLRNDFSRARTQSVEDKDLIIADPQFHFDSESWIMPATESEYKKGIAALRSYLQRLADEDQQDAQFYARSDNLRDYLAQVSKRLGSITQRLGASVGQMRFNINLIGEPGAQQSTPTPSEQVVQTDWLEVDDVFYEARGATWALLHIFRALEYDLNSVLQDKNAVVALRQITRELEGAQQPMWSPIVLNGTGFGLVANHSLVMASYISRANAALVDLRQMLQQG